MSEPVNQQLMEAAKRLTQLLELHMYENDYCGLEVSKHHSSAITGADIALEKAIAAAEQALNAEAQAALTRALPGLHNNDALYVAWHKVGADVAGLSWEKFIEAVTSEQAEAPKPEGFGDMFELDELLKEFERDVIGVQLLAYSQEHIDQSAHAIKAHVRKMLDEAKGQAPKLLGYGSYRTENRTVCMWGSQEIAAGICYDLGPDHKVVAIYEVPTNTEEGKG